MEHRLSMRKKVTLDVLIFRKEFPTVKGKIRNIGLEGMYVETEAVDFPEGVALEVEFAIRSNNEKQDVRQFHLPALVIHSSGKGMGLMFLIFMPAVFETVLNLES